MFIKYILISLKIILNEKNFILYKITLNKQIFNLICFSKLIKRLNKIIKIKIKNIENKLEKCLIEID